MTRIEIEPETAELDKTIQDEPMEGLDVETRGLLASIEIKKGMGFKPDARMMKILTEAARIGSMTTRALTARPSDQRLYLYPGERVWTNPFIQGRYDFLLDGERRLDSRIYMHFYATGITPAMALKLMGKGSQYAIAYIDKEGLKTNADGSVDIYIGQKAPEGLENNWIQTIPGKGWNTILRLYGPLEPWFDKTWIPGDPELVQ